ncbi:MAG TPA: hypothetical protein VGM08_00445 [Candidatus Saccharimonadales bacterium]|jgi:hypothetical protein
MKNDNIELGAIGTQLGGMFKKVGAYRAIIFFLAVASLYGFILWRINAYSNVQPNQNEESTANAMPPHIDQTAVKAILNLQDNSVNVQALFNQARDNPFQE